MRALDRKLLRDLRRMRGQALAIAAVVAAAVTSFVGSASTARSLDESLRRYYDLHGFADVFAGLVRAPRTLRERISEIPGVADVLTRVVLDVPAEAPHFDEPITARLLGVPAHEESQINRPILVSGRMPEPGPVGETLLSEGFAVKHGLGPEDALTVVINGRRRGLRIAGLATSPEFIYQIRPGELLPDEAHFAVMWMDAAELEASAGMPGAFNDVALRLEPGASGPDVLGRLDDLLAPYGGLGAYGRDLHVSHRFITDEIRQLRAMATMMPAIFLGVAVFLLHVVFSRLVGTQREQIATLKAFGVSRAAVAAHYAKFAAAIALAGAAAGTAGGAWFGMSMTEFYANFYHLPLFHYRLDPAVAAEAAALAVGAALLGAASAVLGAVRLAPAVAMRPEAPATFKATLVERLGLHALFSQPWLMVLRNLGRRPVRSVLTALGVSTAVAVLVVGGFFDDAMDFILDFQFRRAQREDVTVVFARERPGAAIGAVAGLPGVIEAEPFRAVQATLRSGHRTRRMSILGLPRNAAMNRPTDISGAAHAMPPDGLLLSAELAEALGVAPGTVLDVDILERNRPRLRVPVAAVVDDMLGLSAWMDIDGLDRLLGGGGLVSGAFLLVDPAAEAALHARLRGMPEVAAVTIKKAALRSFETIAAESVLFFVSVLLVFAVVIAAGVVYSAARVSLAEREWEMGTLRVLGMTRAEVSRILLGELGLLVLLAIPPGFALGRLLSWLIAAAMASDLYRVPLVIDGPTYVFAASTVVAAAVLAGLAVRRHIDRLDLVGVLKAKE